MNFQKIKNIKSLDPRIWIIIIFWFIFYILSFYGIVSYNSNFCSENFSGFCNDLIWWVIGIIGTPVLLFSYLLSKAYEKDEKSNNMVTKHNSNNVKLLIFLICGVLLYRLIGLTNIKLLSRNDSDGLGGFFNLIIIGGIFIIGIIIGGITLLSSLVVLFQKKHKK